MPIRSEVADIRAYLQAIDLWDPCFEPLVCQLVELREARDQAWQRFVEQPVVRGSRGQDRAAPSLETALKLGDRTLRLADQLLLTPRARRRAGIRQVAVDDDFLREFGAYSQDVDDD